MTVRVERLDLTDPSRWWALRERALTEDRCAFVATAVVRAHADAVFLAVDDDGTDVGMVGVLDGPVPEFVSMWVAPQARRSGVGTLLVRRVGEHLAGRATTLRVMAGNTGALEFYGRMGFVLVDRTAAPDGTLRMRWAGSPATTAWRAPAERPRRSDGPRPAPTADQ